MNAVLYVQSNTTYWYPIEESIIEILNKEMEYKYTNF